MEQNLTPKDIVVSAVQTDLAVSSFLCENIAEHILKELANFLTNHPNLVIFNDNGRLVFGIPEMRHVDSDGTEILSCRVFDKVEEVNHHNPELFRALLSQTLKADYVAEKLN